MPDYAQPQRGMRLELAYLHGGEVMYQPGESLEPRVLSDFELVYAIDGWITYVSDGTTYTVPQGGIIFGRPGFHETYHWDPQIKTRHAYFHFGIERYPSDWPDLDGWPRCRTALSPVCSSLFRHILQHIYEHDDWPAVRPEPKDCRLVEALIDTFIEDHRTEVSSFERERPEPVRRALMRTNLSIKEIAERCGFENPLYFSRRFSQAYGCSPTTFRTQLRTGRLPPVKNPLPPDLITRFCW